MRQLLYLEGVSVKLLQGDKRYICAIFMLWLSSTPSECSLVTSRVIVDEGLSVFHLVQMPGREEILPYSATTSRLKT